MGAVKGLGLVDATESGAIDTVERWALALEARDWAALGELFAPGATYVSAAQGELDHLLRHFRMTCRVWQQVVLEIDRPWAEGRAGVGAAVVWGRYRFNGQDRDGVGMSYLAAVTFVLEQAGGRWQITRFHESYLPD